jgi:hypothetical protein
MKNKNNVKKKKRLPTECFLLEAKWNEFAALHADPPGIKRFYIFFEDNLCYAKIMQ